MIPDFNIEINQFSFDGAGYATAMKTAVGKAIQLACKAFLYEADTRISVRTGFLKGAFGTLAQVSGSSLSLAPTNIRPEYYYPTPVGRKGLQRGVHRGGAILKTTTSGQQFSTPPSGIITPTPAPLGWRFNYSVDIRYFAFNDQKYGWDAWRRAIKAFNKTLAEELTFRLPSMTTYLRMIKANVPSQSSPKLESISSLTVVD